MVRADTSKAVVKCLVFRGGSEEETLCTLASALGERGIHVTWSANPHQCFDLLVTRRWDSLIIDASGDAREPLDLLLRVTRTGADVPVLVLVRRGEITTAVRAMKAGAADCIETPVTTARLMSALASLPRQMIHKHPALYESLTPMERVVLRHILNGLTSRQIAGMLCRSPRTIHVHRRRIMAKLGAANLVELVKLEREG
jgi:two-component system response regulator FixJ